MKGSLGLAGLKIFSITRYSISYIRFEIESSKKKNIFFIYHPLKEAMAPRLRAKLTFFLSFRQVSGSTTALKRFF